jgi:cytochrome c556
LALAVAAGGWPGTAFAESAAETVKKRQETMKQLGGHMKAIKTFLESGSGSAEDVAKRAGEIGDIAAKIPGLFPEGTGMDEVKDPKNGAKPEIWLDWEKFLKKHEALREQSAKLAEVVAGGDEAAMKQQFGETAKTCKGCHDDFKN